MRKLLLSIVLGLSTIALFAQIPVSTTPQNKKAIIEEFTGIHCGYCPDGHKIAHDIMVANPGNAFMIAIHQGYYSTPSTGEPDYRTTFGDSIANQTGLTGYPAGTINRHSFGHGMQSGGGNAGANTGESRSFWTADATTIMGQASYVNVGVTAQIDYTTRVLTVHCQLYYTANSTVTSNKLNIALLQNNVKGPQSGSSANPTQVTDDGQYLHMHMLKNLFTGQWGVNIPNTNTASGTMKLDTTFTYTVPAAYNAVPANLAELEVVAFVAEGNQEIISGSNAFVNPPAIDAGVTTIAGLPTIQCANTPIAPTVTIKNIGTTTLTSAVINYTVDGGTPVTQNWTGSLGTGGTQTVTITNPITPTNGHHVFRSYTTNPNGLTDMNAVNDEYQGVYNIFSIYSATPVNEEFTSTAFPPTDWVLDGSGWIRATGSSFGTGVGSAKMPCYDIPSGVISDLYVYGLDLTSGTGHLLTFDHAYAQYSASYIDKLAVQISSNCGTSWTSLFNKQAAALATNGGGMVTSGGFTPTATQWVHNNVDLTAYDGQSNLILRFHATSGYGNNLYIDKIQTGLGAGVNENEAGSIAVYPNPATDFVNIVNAENSNVQLYDIFGKLVASDKVTNNNFILSVSELAQGTYVLKVINGTQIISKKITVLK